MGLSGTQTEISSAHLTKLYPEDTNNVTTSIPAHFAMMLS
jgi:hypothetical protein